jgi:hypothetical protein
VGLPRLDAVQQVRPGFAVRGPGSAPVNGPARKLDAIVVLPGPWLPAPTGADPPMIEKGLAMTTHSPASTTTRRPQWRSRLAVLLVTGAAITGLAATIAALSASASPVAAQPTVPAARGPAVVTGAYTLHYSWGCTGQYADAPLAFNANGTLSFGGFVVGRWVRRDGTLLWVYTAGPAKYAGTIAGPVGTGVMSTFTGHTGCWYLTAAGITGSPQHPAHHQHGLDAAGNTS